MDLANVVGAVVASFMIVGCSRSTVTSDPPAPSAGVAAAKPLPKPPPPQPENEATRIRRADTFVDALAIAKPSFSDTSGDTSDGALLLAIWGIKKMRWSDVSVVKDETSFALVRKDPDEARGKRLCVPGRLVQIETLKSDAGKYFSGLISSTAGNLFHFLAIGSSGELVEMSNMRFCGAVVGTYDYRNSGGGVGHAVQVVGMFDLPENRKTAAADTAAATSPAAPPMPVVAAPAMGPGQGVLFLVTTPVSSVTEDGAVLGTTPLKIALSEGQHNLLMTSEDQTQIRGLDVTIVAGKTITRSMPLR